MHVGGQTLPPCYTALMERQPAGLSLQAMAPLLYCIMGSLSTNGLGTVGADAASGSQSGSQETPSAAVAEGIGRGRMLQINASMELDSPSID